MHTLQFVRLQFLDLHLLHCAPAQIAHHRRCNFQAHSILQPTPQFFRLIFVSFRPNLLKLRSSDNHHGTFDAYPTMIKLHTTANRHVTFFRLIFFVQLLKLRSSADHRGTFDAYPTTCETSIFQTCTCCTAHLLKLHITPNVIFRGPFNCVAYPTFFRLTFFLGRTCSNCAALPITTGHLILQPTPQIFRLTFVIFRPNLLKSSSRADHHKIFDAHRTLWQTSIFRLTFVAPHTYSNCAPLPTCTNCAPPP